MNPLQVYVILLFFAFLDAPKRFIVRRNPPESPPERTLWPISVPPYPSSLLLPARKGPSERTLEHDYALFFVQGSIRAHP